MMKYHFIFILASVIRTFARPAQDVLAISKPRPLVIWHGLGDQYDAPGILKFQSHIEEMYPGIFIHSVYIDPDSKADQRATVFGNVNKQVEMVAQQLKDLSQLSQGFDGIGFSQGGLFLRAYVERHNDPPIRNLITFGSPHMGISDITCKPHDVFCELGRNAARAGMYTEWAQQNLVQAQYYRDTERFVQYLESNHFLGSINNEVPTLHNATYAARLSQLENLVLVHFTEDRTVVPKESAWFGSYAIPDDEEECEGEEADSKSIVPMREQPLYTEDWIGLRTLDESGRIVFQSCESEHMHILPECLKPLLKQYVGAPL
ncbi:alpha/beta-hydrolase [Lactifluus volemus]|nr:alpha/beta-hydrolase [Lactifluus volemus]